ncbi:MAG: ABC transporter permease [Anaerolineae bacterium]|nr:ABC transporter permease [Anaerolineae bacterium]
MIWKVFRYELGRNLRRKGYLFTTLGIPLLALLLPLAYQALTSLDVNLGLDAVFQSGDRTAQAAGYVDETGLFTDPGALIRYPDEAAARRAMQAHEVATYYIIPADYVATGDVIQVMPTFSLAAIDDEAIREVILNTLAQNVQPQVVQRLEDPARFTDIKLNQGGAQQAGSFDSSFLLVYVFTLSLLLSVFMTNGYLMQGVIEEKESRVIEILMSTLRPTQLLVGKILAFGTMGLIQMLAWVGGILVLLRLANVLDVISSLAVITVPLDVLPLVLVYFVLAYLFFASAYGILGALSVSMREGPQFAAVFTLPAVIPLWFIALFIENPNAPLAVALSLIPVTAPLAMIERLLMTSVPGWQIALSLVLMVLLIVGMLWLAGRLFRVTTLLSGQLPKLRDLPRLMRG